MLAFIDPGKIPFALVSQISLHPSADVDGLLQDPISAGHLGVGKLGQAEPNQTETRSEETGPIQTTPAPAQEACSSFLSR